ncbi:hypothetical protein Tco_0667429 [Tanacetum coccineum]
MSTQFSSNQIGLHLPNPDKSLQFRPIEVFESDNLFLDHIHGEDKNVKDIQMADHLRPMEELLRIPIEGAAETWLENEPPNSITTWDDLVSNGWKSDEKEYSKTLTIIEKKAKVRTCRNKPQVSSSGGSSIQNDAITALTKQVEALGHHISSMQEAYNRNQEAPIQLMQNQMGQIPKAFQKRLSCVPPSNTVTKPVAELNVITSMDGLTLDGSFIPHFLVYQEEELEPETITKVVEISSSQNTPLVPPLETPPLSAPKPKEDPKPNPHQPPIPSRLEEEKIQALENHTGCADHFVYRIDIVDSLCDKFPIENNSLSGNPTPSSDFMVESLSPLPTPYGDSDSLMEETDTLLSHFNDSSPKYETFCFDHIEETSSGSTTSHSDFSLSDYEVFCFEEKSSDSTTSHSNHSFSEHESLCFDIDHTTSHSDLSLPKYESFYFDLMIDQLPPVDRSNSHHEEFFDELTHIISPPEYDRFYFDIETDPGELTIVFKENISKDSTKEFTSPELNDFPLLLSDCDFAFSKEFSEIDLLVLFLFGNKDKIFDPGIFIIKRVQSKRFHIFPLDDFPTFSFVSDSLLLIDTFEIETFLSFSSGNEDKIFDPGILFIHGIFSFTRKSPHLLINNFMIDNCHILSEISLKIVSSISFHPKDKEIRGESS